MKKNRTHLIVLVLMALVAAGCAPVTQPPTSAPVEPTSQPQAASPTAVPEVEKLQVALLLYGPLADTGWNGTAYDGLKQAESELGVDVSLAEDVKVPDIEAVLRDYASRGYDLVIGHSFPFAEPAMAVAPDFPDTIFTVTNGYTETVECCVLLPR